MKYILFLLIVLSSVGSAQTLSGGGEANPNLGTHPDALRRWQHLRFGMFIHWGPVSLRGTEIGWSRGREVPIAEYDQLYTEFNPVLFNADEWVTTAKSAGMKYIILVTKHHDGFALWDSDHTDYDIMAGPFKRDIVWEISRACKRHDILFGTYYSILDWYHPDYPIELQDGKRAGKPDANMQKYIPILKGQVRELVEQYDTQILWFDGEWEDPWTHEMGMDLYAWARGFYNELLINNRVDKGREGMDGVSKGAQFAGDFETPEQRVGAYNPETPWESCITIAKQWAWKPNDQLKSAEECIRTLVQTAGGDGNLLLNVSPMLDGRLEQRQIDVLTEVGDWLQLYGESNYGTRGGPIPPQEWGVTTYKGDKVFVHVLYPQPEILLPGFSEPITSARMSESGESLSFSMTEAGLALTLPDTAPDVVDRIIVLQ